MNENDRAAIVSDVSEWRDPTEADEKLFAALSPGGAIARFGKSYNALNTNNRMIFMFFGSFTERYRLASGSFDADDFHPYFRYVTKRAYFRPGDEILTFDGPITRPDKIKKYFNQYAPSLYAIYLNSPSFAVDLALANCDTEELACREFFVVPPESGKIKKLFASVYGLRKCGLITSDGIIRIVSGDTDVASVPKAVIPPLPAASSLDIDSAEDFYAGFYGAFAEMIDAVSPYEFPFNLGSQNKPFADITVYRLGFAALHSHRYNAVPRALKEIIRDASGLYVSFLPLNVDEFGVSPFSADKILYAITKDISSSVRGPKVRTCMAAKFITAAITSDMFGGYGIENFQATDNASGGVILLTEKPFEARQVGRLVLA